MPLHEGGPAKLITPGLPAALGEPTAYAQALLLRVARALDLVAGWVFVLDPDAPQADRLELLADYCVSEQANLIDVGRALLIGAPLRAKPTGGEIEEWLPPESVKPFRAAGARTSAIAPIVVDDQPVGSLIVVSRREWGELVECMLSAMAAQLALILDHVQRDREVWDRLHRAERRVCELEASIAEESRLERELLHRNRQLTALSDIARALKQAVGLDEVLHRAVDCVVDVLQVEASMVRLVDGDRLLLATHRGLSAEFVAEFEYLSIDGSTSGLAVRLGEPQVIDDCATDPRIVHPAVAREGIVSVALLPMVANGKVVGVLNALSRRPRRFTQDDVGLLAMVATEIGIAVENARLYEAERRCSLALEELNRLKTDFVLNISHELRTPMAIVKGSLDALQSNWHAIDESRRRTYVALGWQGAGRLKRLLEDLLLVSRIETSPLVSHLEAVELPPLVQQAVSAVLAEHPGRQVDVLLPADLPPVLADHAAVGRILLSLLDNAVKYSPADTPISLSGEVVGGEARVSVVDRGSGIAPEAMSRLFQRFERLDPTVRPNPGIGLGLYTCRQLAESMGGRVWVESVPRQGSTFTVALRVAPAKGSGSGRWGRKGARGVNGRAARPASLRGLDALDTGKQRTERGISPRNRRQRASDQSTWPDLDS